MAGPFSQTVIAVVWACEFIEAHHPPGYAKPEQRQLFPSREITALGYQIDNTSKTRALFEINKGTNKRPEIHVNSALPSDLRRVPFEHMIYVADGPSDVPAWSVVRANGGPCLRRVPARLNRAVRADQHPSA